MRISDWSSDVCSSDLLDRLFPRIIIAPIDDGGFDPETRTEMIDEPAARTEGGLRRDDMVARRQLAEQRGRHRRHAGRLNAARLGAFHQRDPLLEHRDGRVLQARIRSEEHTSELQSLMRISYAVFCWKKKTKH